MDLNLHLPTSKKELEELMEKAKDWALMHGMCMKSKQNFNKNVLQFAPFILVPSPFPRKEFENACTMQTTLNILIHRVAQDYNFLKETLEETIKVDNFTKELFDICTTVHKEGGSAQKISLCVLRSDLMLDTTCPKEDMNKKCIPYCCWKQVEINTIASGFGWLGPVSTELHKFVLEELGCYEKIKNLPENNALQIICSSMIEAWKMYGNQEAVILFVVEDITYNICDQRFHEFEIRKQNPNVKVIRRNLTQLAASAKLGLKKELIVDDYIVSVVYYRCGYEPGQYHTRKEWDVRLLIERSLAIKCPTIQYHLAGTKKVQQALAKPGVINKFLENEKICAEIKEIFTALPDVIHAVAKYQVEHEPREIFFFREGTVVMWNISDLESENILNFLKQYEENCYMATIVQSESEMMCYSYADNGKQSRIKDGNIVLGSNATNLDKFTFSNAMAQSVKLGIWEASLDIYINSIEFVTEDLKAGRKLQLTRQEVLKKQGELFALRHLINLSSDLLDVPDFYWERDDLEQLYQQICSYFNIAKRTRVINEKLNHCVELVSILSAHLSDRHHIRLEWMIIVLIMVEVVFETLHYMDRYFS
nr:PREDICTED: glutathione synthetase-like [Megachile rotundata]XP_012153749.1 PREDICTED: glutathione synthetase-like [Megachile rotundata]XP_012153750.1 PREDICTED: glutathione synthetase-like [Megachile rotundata]XP_012153751.1 PREDICTED: glutathione synthetase-like [Megachile rotundata]XP_012153752.1 PREDICTED: glutathione synthetase-like [Megachile rotundata]